MIQIKVGEPYFGEDFQEPFGTLLNHHPDLPAGRHGVQRGGVRLPAGLVLQFVRGRAVPLPDAAEQLPAGKRARGAAGAAAVLPPVGRLRPPTDGRSALPRKGL